MTEATPAPSVQPAAPDHVGDMFNALKQGRISNKAALVEGAVLAHQYQGIDLFLDGLVPNVELAVKKLATENPANAEKYALASERVFGALDYAVSRKFGANGSYVASADVLKAVKEFVGTPANHAGLDEVAFAAKLVEKKVPQEFAEHIAGRFGQFGATDVNNIIAWHEKLGKFDARKLTPEQISGMIKEVAESSTELKGGDIANKLYDATEKAKVPVMGRFTRSLTAFKNNFKDAYGSEGTIGAKIAITGVTALSVGAIVDGAGRVGGFWGKQTDAEGQKQATLVGRALGLGEAALGLVGLYAVSRPGAAQLFGAGRAAPAAAK